MSVMESTNDLDFVMPSQVEDNDIADPLQPNPGVQCYAAGGNGTEEYDELRDVITNDPEAIWQTTAGVVPTVSSPAGILVSAANNVATVLKADSKHIYTTATVVEHVQPHLVSMPPQQMAARQPAKKRKAARPGHYGGERKGNARVASGQEVLFSCDQCSVTFTDPQQAIKHISERHMMAPMPTGEGHMETMELHESQVLVGSKISLYF